MAVEYHTYYAQRIKKDGKPGAWIEHRAKITRLLVCDICGLLGPLKKITYRSDCNGWNLSKDDWTTPSKDTLCVPCWNKVRALQNKERAILSTTRFINKVRKEITYETRNNGRASELSSVHDARG